MFSKARICVAAYGGHVPPGTFIGRSRPSWYVYSHLCRGSHVFCSVSCGSLAAYVHAHARMFAQGCTCTHDLHRVYAFVCACVCVCVYVCVREYGAQAREDTDGGVVVLNSCSENKPSAHLQPLLRKHKNKNTSCRHKTLRPFRVTSQQRRW